jgi:hypothetical protein
MRTNIKELIEICAEVDKIKAQIKIKIQSDRHRMKICRAREDKTKFGVGLPKRQL